MSTLNKITLADIAEAVGFALPTVLDGQTPIDAIASLESAQAGTISFFHNAKYVNQLSETNASFVFVLEEHAKHCGDKALVVENPYLAYARVATLFDRSPKLPLGIHPTAVIGKECKIDDDVCIGPYVVIGDYVTIKSGVCINAHVTISDYCCVGTGTTIHPRVTIYHDVKIGNNVVIHSGVVIGADGFGNAQHEGKWISIPQIGGVRIEDDVNIGANTTIDRGALEDTLICKGVRLDNLIQIGHNVQVGEYTAIAAHSAIAGSTKVGKNCLIGGAAAINGHITLTDNIFITGSTDVYQSLTKPGVYSSGTGTFENRDWRKLIVRFKQLDKMMRQMKHQLEPKENIA